MNHHVYALDVMVSHKRWSQNTVFDFFGRKFDTYEEALNVGMKYNPEKTYYAGCKKTEIIITEIQNYCLPNTKLIRSYVLPKYFKM